MGFTDLVSDAGLAVLNSFLSTRSYITGYVHDRFPLPPFGDAEHLFYMMIPMVRVSEQPQDLRMNTNPALCCTSDPLYQTCPLSSPLDVSPRSCPASSPPRLPDDDLFC